MRDPARVAAASRQLEEGPSVSPLAWTKVQPTVPGHYDVRGSTVIWNGCTTVGRMDDGTMYVRCAQFKPYTLEQEEQITTFGGPRDLKVHWGGTEWRGPIEA